MLKTVFILNSEAGGIPWDRKELEQILFEEQIEAEVREVHPPCSLWRIAESAVSEGARTLAACGGDGTVATIAAVAARADAVLGVIPNGTLNHFARDLGLPLDRRAAVRLLAHGITRRVDLGEVNGRLFINNCSIGFYPHLVRRREDQRQRLGRGKWFAMAVAAISLFRRYPLVQVTIETAGCIVQCKTPLVFIGNNRYQTDLMSLGRRTALDRGELCVYLAKATTRLEFLLLAFRMLLGRLEQARDFESMTVTHLRIETQKKRLRVAFDGEVLGLKPPLVCRVHPGMLQVIAP